MLKMTCPGAFSSIVELLQWLASHTQEQFCETLTAQIQPLEKNVKLQTFLPNGKT